jgi:hypothetical protein
VQSCDPPPEGRNLPPRPRPWKRLQGCTQLRRRLLKALARHNFAPWCLCRAAAGAARRRRNDERTALTTKRADSFQPGRRSALTQHSTATRHGCNLLRRGARPQRPARMAPTGRSERRRRPGRRRRCSFLSSAVQKCPPHRGCAEPGRVPELHCIPVGGCAVLRPGRPGRRRPVWPGGCLRRPTEGGCRAAPRRGAGRSPPGKRPGGGPAVAAPAGSGLCSRDCVVEARVQAIECEGRGSAGAWWLAAPCGRPGRGRPRQVQDFGVAGAGVETRAQRDARTPGWVPGGPCVSGGGRMRGGGLGRLAPRKPVRRGRAARGALPWPACGRWPSRHHGASPGTAGGRGPGSGRRSDGRKSGRGCGREWGARQVGRRPPGKERAGLWGPRADALPAGAKTSEQRERWGRLAPPTRRCRRRAGRLGTGGGPAGRAMRSGGAVQGRKGGGQDAAAAPA